MPVFSPIASAATLFIACCQTAIAEEERAPSTAAGQVLLSNSDFRLPPNSQWKEERILSAPKFRIAVGVGGKRDVKGTMSIISRQLMHVDVLTGKDLRLKFVQSDSTSDIDFGINPSHHTTVLPLDGETVLAQRGDKGRWSARLDGRRRATAAESAALHGLTYLWANGVYPDRKVAIGESWEIDASSFRNLFGSDIYKTAGNFEFTFARIIEYEGEECAKITGRGKLTGQTNSLSDGKARSAGSPIAAEMDLSIEILRSIKLGVDLAINMKGTLVLDNEDTGEAFTYRASSPVEITRTLRRR